MEDFISIQLSLFESRPLALHLAESNDSSIFSALGTEFKPGWVDEFGQRLRRWSLQALPTRIKTLSLFSGAGGLDIGFHDAGFDVLSMVELEPRFADTLSSNSGVDAFFGSAAIYCGDIRNFLPRPHMEVDFIIGGPPCQTFSAAGRRAAGVYGISDERGLLFQEYVRLLKSLKPRGFLFENVYGITGAEDGRAWREINDAFRAAGYRLSHRILDAADYGVPQHRERLFIVGTREGNFLFPRPTHGPDSPNQRPYYTAGEAVAGVPLTPEERKSGLRGRFGHLLNEIPPGLNYSFFTEKMGHPHPIFAWRSKFSDFLYKADPLKPTRTLKAQGGQYTGPFHWENRPFSVSELKRLQTIPDSYNIIGKRQAAIHQIGNSVAPQIGRILALTILKQLFGVELPAPLPMLEQYEQLGFRQRKRDLTAVYRAKAHTALRLSTPDDATQRRKSRSHTYRAKLSDNFAWTLTYRAKDSLHVACRFGQGQWKIHVCEDRNSAADAFYITVRSAPSSIWALDDTEVVLAGDRLSRQLFTGVWKAFEAELIRLHIKADLVQLCGYYQYSPAFRCSLALTVKTSTWEWDALGHVVAGYGVAQILRADEMAGLYGIRSEQVLDFGMWLRSLGYEVRNHYTNPQIPEGSYLIPYAFPTLVPMSVQLRKSLLRVPNVESE